MGMLKKLGVLVATISILTPLAGCGKKPKTEKVDYASQVNVSEEPTKGYIWEASKDGKVIHLVGTKHPAPKNVNFFNETLNKIVDEADVLGVELDITDAALFTEAQTLLNDQYTSKDGTLKERLNDEEFAKLEILLKDFNMSYGHAKNFSDAGIQAIILSHIIQKTDFTGTGLDQALIEKFNTPDKKVVSLETPQIQANAVSTIQSLTPLSDTLLEYDSETYLDSQVKTIIDGFNAYVTGDKIYPEETIKEGRSEFEKKGVLAAYDELNKTRNTGMVAKINEYIEEDEKYVIAVGYMHFFGEDSILKLLETEGYTIKDIA